MTERPEQTRERRAAAAAKYCKERWVAGVKVPHESFLAGAEYEALWQTDGDHVELSVDSGDGSRAFTVPLDKDLVIKVRALRKQPDDSPAEPPPPPTPRKTRKQRQRTDEGT